MTTRRVDEVMASVELSEDVFLLANLAARASAQPVAEWVADVIRNEATSLALSATEDDVDDGQSPSEPGEKTSAMFEIFRRYVEGVGPTQLNGSLLGRMVGAHASYGRRCYGVWSKAYQQGVPLDMIALYPIPGAPLKFCGDCGAGSDARRLAH